MATKLIVLFTAAVFLASLAYSLRPDDGDREAGKPRTPPEGGAPSGPRLLGPRVRELRATQGIWSAWKPFPPVAGEPTTVLWRTEGTVAPLTISGRRGRERMAIRFGPTPVLPTLAGAGLRWRRAGREWGSSIVFPSAGVWAVRVRAGGRTGAVRVRVVELRPAAG